MIDFENISNLDDETLTSLVATLTKEKNKRDNEKRLAIICKIKDMLSEIDSLCFDYDISITTDCNHETDDRIYLKDYLSID